MDTVCLEVGAEIKTQQVRLLDVFLIGPLMVWGGSALKNSGHPLAGTLLSITGVATVVYNGKNYLLVKEKLGRR